MKRQRGRGRKPGGGGHHTNYSGGNAHPNRAMESNGPEVKVRGPAAHIYERYLQLARDAASSGDRVLSENYLQHADHYFRLLRAMQPAAPPPQHDRFGDQDFDGEDEGGPENEAAERQPAAAEADEQPRADFPQAEAPAGAVAEEGGEFRRRRGRRGRYRANPEGAEGGAEGGEEQSPDQQPQRAERPERRERAPRESAEAAGPEGFSSGPKPAFLSGGD